MRAEVEQAVRILQNDEGRSMEQALALLQDTIFSFSMRVCGQREDAEDTTQEVLLQSIPQLPKFDSPRALVVWLYKVAKSRCLMNRRKSKFAPARELSLEELMPDGKELARLTADGRVNPEDFAIRGEQASQVRHAIQKLPPQYRIILVLRDMEGLTDDEVAEVTGIRVGTIRVRLHRARLFVRKALMRTWMARSGKSSVTAYQAKMPERRLRCKAMFAELSNYVDAKLDDSICAELEKHMEGCGPCQAFVATLEATIQQCKESSGASAPRARARMRKELIEKYQQVRAILPSHS